MPSFCHKPKVAYDSKVFSETKWKQILAILLQVVTPQF